MNRPSLYLTLLLTLGPPLLVENGRRGVARAFAGVRQCRLRANDVFAQ